MSSCLFYVRSKDTQQDQVDFELRGDYSVQKSQVTILVLYPITILYPKSIVISFLHGWLLNWIDMWLRSTQLLPGDNLSTQFLPEVKVTQWNAIWNPETHHNHRQSLPYDITERSAAGFWLLPLWCGHWIMVFGAPISVVHRRRGNMLCWWETWIKLELH